MISVAAIDSNGALSGFSNYGVGTVQLAAPGVNILSTEGGGYAYDSGTSMAAPFVTGTVALVEAAHPTWSMSQVIDAVVDHTTPDPALAGKVTTGGVVNAAAAVANTDGAYVVSATPNGSVTSTSPLSSVQVDLQRGDQPRDLHTGAGHPHRPRRHHQRGHRRGGRRLERPPVRHLVPHPDRRRDLHPESRPDDPGLVRQRHGPEPQRRQRRGLRRVRRDISGTPPSATLVNRDTTTQGNWIGTYGSQGYNIIGNATSYPAYATVTPAGQSTYTWAASTTDPRALETVGGTGRIAACWYSNTSFSVDVNLTDGQTHDIDAVRARLGRQRTERADPDHQRRHGGRPGHRDVSSNFSGGVYLQWTVSGNVVITFTHQTGYNAVVSGLFFDPPPLHPATDTHRDRLAWSSRTPRRRATGSEPTALRATTSSAMPPATPPTPPSRPPAKST